MPVDVVAGGHASQIAWFEFGPARWWEWVLGAVAAELACGRLRPHPLYASRRVALLALLAALLSQWSRTGWVLTDLCWGVVCFVVVHRALRAEAEGKWRGWWVGPLERLGQASYSLYLIHVPLLLLLAGPLGKLPLPLAVPTALLSCVAVSLLFFRLCEQPAMRWARQRRG
jgi:peptidoglycan/LPS O-acetylase OafA/YrhL